MLWGDQAERLFIAVHGNMSHKADDVIAILAEEAVPLGYGVLSFDLPRHGERKDEPRTCEFQNCIDDLQTVMDYARQLSNHLSVFACSMGAYFSLMAYGDVPIEQCLFLSPVVDMERIIKNMMRWFAISEERLSAEKEILTPAGQMMYWDDYCYVRSHPVQNWDPPTAILYGSKDEISEYDAVSSFAEHNGCELTIMEGGEHFFHTDVQLQFFRRWLMDHISINETK